MDRISKINSVLNGHSVRLREKYFKKNQSEIYVEIDNFCINISDLPFNQKVWHWVNDYSDYFRCKCGKKTTFHKNWLDGYRKWCSPKCAQEDSLTKEKRKLTTISKYGVDNIAKLDEIKRKQAETNIERYGNKSSFQNEVVKNKWRDKIKHKYGVEHIFQLKSIKEKSKKTSLKKWGSEYYVQSESYKDKLEDIGFSEKLKLIYFKKHVEKYQNFDLNFINISDRILEINSQKCGHTFSIHYDSLKRRIENNYECCVICNPISSGQSQEEKSLINWIKSLSIDLVEGDRTFGFELDIFIPSMNFAIEFNGLYWHSELYKDKYYHLNKTEVCRNNGIQLFHIWEDDWKFRTDVVKSILLNRFNMNTTKISARKCAVRLVNNREKDSFLDENHIQGKCVSSYNIGLYFENKLVSLMTFGKRSINSKEDFELLRFCNIKNTSVVGAASKLFNYFINNHNFASISSFADVSHFSGELYKKLGFNYVHRSDTNYWWVVDGIRHHRFNFNKKRLVKEGFDSDLTEVQIMYNRGYFRVFGCGQDKYIYQK